jgi:hypothetical protein
LLAWRSLEVAAPFPIRISCEQECHKLDWDEREADHRIVRLHIEG